MRHFEVSAGLHRVAAFWQWLAEVLDSDHASNPLPARRRPRPDHVVLLKNEPNAATDVSRLQNEKAPAIADISDR